MSDVMTHGQIVATLGEFGDFESVTGGDPVQNMTDYYEPGARTPRKISFTGNFNDVVLTRAYVNGRDNQLVEWWKRKLAGVDPLPRKLVKKFRNALGMVEDSQTFQVHVKDVKTPDGKAGDNTIAEVQVTCAVEAIL